jgi:hypothetical protein
MPPPLSLTYDDFRSLRRNQRIYIDKTHFIDEFLTTGAMVTLIARPRRFGKSLFLSTLRYFLEADTAETRADLFADLWIATTPWMKSHFQKFPVITLDLKGVRGKTWAELGAGIAHAVKREYIRHDYLTASSRLSAVNHEAWQALATGKSSMQELAWSLELLSRLLQKHHQKPVYILIDEYDAPIHQAWLKGCYLEAIDFFRTFYGEAFKGNPALAQGVLTGVLKIAKEGIFSSFNNPQIVTVLSRPYAKAFGFTEAEVEQLLQLTQGPLTIESLRDWYNGYRMGPSTLYNPWSVLSALQEEPESLRAYWVETASNEVLTELIRRTGPELQEAIPHWLEGGTLESHYVDTLLLSQGSFTLEEVCSLLLHSGYFTPASIRWEEGEAWMQLKIPNREVKVAFRQASRSWLSHYLGAYATVEQLCRALLEGQVERVEASLSRVVLAAVGQADVADNPKKQVYPEQFYHAFVLGVLVALESTHRVVSNRESGLGRPDIMILPKRPGQAGVALEFKKLTGKLETVIKGAILQVEQKKYRTELELMGASPSWLYVVVFDGKEVFVKLV